MEEDPSTIRYVKVNRSLVQTNCWHSRQDRIPIGFYIANRTIRYAKRQTHKKTCFCFQLCFAIDCPHIVACPCNHELPTVTKDANAHARLGYVRSQSLASTTTFPVETRGRLGKLLPTSALKNVGKTKSTPLSKTPADEHIFSPPDGAHRCSSDAESTRKADRANFRSSSTRPHSDRSPDKCHECVKKGHLHWGEPCEPLRLAISWSSWWCYWAHRRQWERKSRSLFRTSRWGQSPPRRGCGVDRKDLDTLSWHCRARKTCIDDWTLAWRNVKEAILFASRQISFRKVIQPGVGVERLLVFPTGPRAANTWAALLLYVRPTA